MAKASPAMCLIKSSKPSAGHTLTHSGTPWRPARGTTWAGCATSLRYTHTHTRTHLHTHARKHAFTHNLGRVWCVALSSVENVEPEADERRFHREINFANNQRSQLIVTFYKRPQVPRLSSYTARGQRLGRGGAASLPRLVLAGKGALVTVLRGHLAFM